MQYARSGIDSENVANRIYSQALLEVGRLLTLQPSISGHINAPSHEATGALTLARCIACYIYCIWILDAIKSPYKM